MEAMLYISTRLREENDKEGIYMYSDSESNVNCVNSVAGGAEVSGTKTQPTRTRRMATLLRASGGQLSWCKGHQDQQNTEEAKRQQFLLYSDQEAWTA